MAVMIFFDPGLPALSVLEHKLGLEVKFCVLPQHCAMSAIASSEFVAVFPNIYSVMKTDMNGFGTGIT